MKPRTQGDLRWLVCWLLCGAGLMPVRGLGYLVAMPEGLDKMAVRADLICKARVTAIVMTTHSGFREIPGYPTAAATLEVISVLKGDPGTNAFVLEHYTEGTLPMGRMYSPQHYELRAGQAYLVFCLKTDRAGVFRQIRDSHTLKVDEGVMRTLDARPLGALPVKEAHWQELSLLLTNAERTNRLYAIDQMDAMSLSCSRRFRNVDDFRRDAVLQQLIPLCTNSDDAVAVAALKCFDAGPDCGPLIAPHAAALVEIANGATTVSRRVAAMAPLASAPWEVVSNSFPKWIRAREEEVRVQAVQMLASFPGPFAEGTLKERSKDESPKVRAAVAVAIGDGKFTRLLPVLEELFGGPTGRPEPVPPSRTEDSDVHTSAGSALLKFDVGQVSDFLKAHLTDAGFRPAFLCKLAEKEVGPWVGDLTELFEQRRAQKEAEATASKVEPRASYLKGLMALTGTYFQAWHILQNYLQGMPKEAFAGGRLDRTLDALENAGDTGSQEPMALYEMYRRKGLEERAVRFRAAYEKNASYDVGIYFKRVDAKFESAGKGP